MIENEHHRNIKSIVPKKTLPAVRKQINYIVLSKSNTKRTQNRWKDSGICKQYTVRDRVGRNKAIIK